MKSLIKKALLALVGVIFSGILDLNAQPQIQPLGLENTTWKGEETLKNYGPLEFRFGPNGSVIMVDKDGSNEGSYTFQGNRVVLRFYNNTVVYQGQIVRDLLRGTASQSRNNLTWEFMVRRGAMAMPPSPPLPPIGNLQLPFPGNEPFPPGENPPLN